MNPPLLHIYPQTTAHDSVQIVGTAAGLRLLARALANAMKTGQGTATVFTADGEGFTLTILQDNSPWTGPAWTHRALPYTDSSSSPHDEMP